MSYPQWGRVLANHIVGIDGFGVLSVDDAALPEVADEFDNAIESILVEVETAVAETVWRRKAVVGDISLGVATDAHLGL